MCYEKNHKMSCYKGLASGYLVYGNQPPSMANDTTITNTFLFNHW